MDIVGRGFGVSKPAQGFNHVRLGVGLAAINYVVDRLCATEMRMRLLTHFGRDPTDVIGIGKEARVAEARPNNPNFHK